MLYTLGDKGKLEIDYEVLHIDQRQFGRLELLKKGSFMF